MHVVEKNQQIQAVKSRQIKTVQRERDRVKNSKEREGDRKYCLVPLIETKALSNVSLFVIHGRETYVK